MRKKTEKQNIIDIYFSFRYSKSVGMFKIRYMIVLMMKHLDDLPDVKIISNQTKHF